MNGLGDRELLERYIGSRDEAAFTELVERYKGRLHAFAYKMTGNEADALDICQKVFVQVFLNATKFEWRSSFKTWLYRIAMNMSLNHIESRGAEPVEDIDNTGVAADDTPHGEILEREKKEMIRRAVDELPWKQRVTVIMRIYEDLSYAEIADALECPLGTVKANMHHALIALRKKLGSGTGF